MNNGVEVFSEGLVSGLLTRSDRADDTFLFSYGVGVDPARAVSLTMPVMSDQYDSMGFLHPVFEMNLPEGALRQRLELMFAKTVKHFDALALLEIVGTSQIGRLRYASQGLPLPDVPSQSLPDILTYGGTEDLFASLLDRFARHSGISGVQPKVLIRSAGVPLDRVTDRGATHIIKSFDPREYPDLAANEYFSMRAAHLAGLPTPPVALSANRSILSVERFDRTRDGRYRGVEDFCVLSGLRANGRYSGSYEGLAHKVQTFVSPEHHPAAMRQLFGTVALACLIRNGDAHLKNFAILYDSPGGSVRLAPVYDMLSTAPYLPGDPMALELDGSKRFPSQRQLIRFGRQACGLSNAVTTQLLASVRRGISQAMEEMQTYAAVNPGFRRSAEHFLKVFRAGLAAD